MLWCLLSVQFSRELKDAKGTIAQKDGRVKQV